MYVLISYRWNNGFMILCFEGWKWKKRISSWLCKRHSVDPRMVCAPSAIQLVVYRKHSFFVRYILPGGCIVQSNGQHEEKHTHTHAPCEQKMRTPIMGRSYRCKKKIPARSYLDTKTWFKQSMGNSMRDWPIPNEKLLYFI